MTEPDHSARSAAVQVVQVLRRAGHVAYLAGGCVRDGLLGLTPKDYDVATDARPEVVRGLFKRSQYVGEAFGVVLVYGGAGVKSRKAEKQEIGTASTAAAAKSENSQGGRPAAASQPAAWGAGGVPGVEVATFRKEWGYEDGRRPSGIEFTDAKHDAQRRDFTVNGLFADPLDEKLEPVAPGCEKVIDYVGGRADLEAGVLRAIGEPGERFAEDYLRMLRAARFAARLGFTIESGTAKAIRASAKHLGKVSRERIGQEVMWMLTPTPAPGSIPGSAPGSTAGNTAAAGSIHTGPGRPAAASQSAAWEGAQGGVPGEASVGTTRGKYFPGGYSGAVAAGLIQSLELDGPTLDGEHVQGALLPALSGVSGLDWGPGGSSYAVALAAWMLDRHGVSGSLADAARFVKREARQVVRRWRRALCLSNGDRDALWDSLSLLPAADGWAGLGVAKRKRLLASSGWPGAWALVRVIGAGGESAVIEAESAPLVAEGVAPEPWVTGDDILGMGVEPGPRIGELLEGVYDAQLEGRVRDRGEGLAWVKGALGE